MTRMDEQCPGEPPYTRAQRNQDGFAVPPGSDLVGAELMLD